MTDVQIREIPLHRAFMRPDRHELPVKGLIRMAGSCTSPVFIRYAEFVDQERSVRCRNCPSCLRARRFQWAQRAFAETLQSPNTWFFTGTHRSQTHDYEEAKDEVQRFLKRLRKREWHRAKKRAPESAPPPSSLRYLLLPELHKSGAIHWHGLLHHGGDITYRMVADSWTAGYSYPSAVKNKEKCAYYITKYCTKDLLGASDGDDGRNRRPRILASRSPTYGEAAIIRDQELVQALARANTEELTETWRKNLIMAIKTMQAGHEGPKTAHRLLIEHQARKALQQEMPEAV